MLDDLIMEKLRLLYLNTTVLYYTIATCTNMSLHHEVIITSSAPPVSLCT